MNLTRASSDCITLYVLARSDGCGSGAAVCRWVDSVGFCTATVEGPEGDQFVSTNIASAVCLANTVHDTLDGGCFEGPCALCL